MRRVADQHRVTAVVPAAGASLIERPESRVFRRIEQSDDVRAEAAKLFQQEGFLTPTRFRPPCRAGIGTERDGDDVEAADFLQRIGDDMAARAEIGRDGAFVDG
ncbi:hypothetical protein D3C86_1458130 [compost metagenome]